MKSFLISLLIGFSSASFNRDQELEHKQDFMDYDRNQDGYIDASEVRESHDNLDQADISSFFMECDLNEDGRIDYTEYHAWGEDIQRKKNVRDE